MSISRSWRVSNFTPADRVPARTDAQAKDRFLRFLNRSLSTVSKNAMWTVGQTAGEAFAAFTVPEAVLLRTPHATLYLRSTLQFTYADDQRFGGKERKVSTHHYAHTVAEAQRLTPQLYSWEWAASEPTYPHLHLRRSDPAFQGLGKLHIPTGRVFYEDVLLFLITEHQVQHVRDDWKSVLDDSFRRVSTFSSWGGRPES